MLLKFTISNYRSYKNTTAMELVASSIKEHPENVFTTKLGTQPLRVLTTAALTGNSSTGKSNWLNGFRVMQHMILNSTHEITSNPVEAFRLNTEKEQKATVFECTMLIKNVVYRYGFRCSKNEIIAEWLNMKVRRREEIIFSRLKNEYNIVKPFSTAVKNKYKLLSEVTQKNVLFLSVLSQFNIDIARQISQWFLGNVLYNDATPVNNINYTAGLLANPICGQKITELIKIAEPGFCYLQQQTGENSGQPQLKIKHIKYDIRNKPVDEVYMDLYESGSSGTQKLVAVIGPLVKALTDGGVFWLDDLDANIQPNMIPVIFDLFNSAKHNPKGAQFFFVSQNQKLDKYLRRDQIIFVNKNNFGASSLSTLSLHKAQLRAGNISKSDDSADKSGILGIPENINLVLKSHDRTNNVLVAKAGYSQI